MTAMTNKAGMISSIAISTEWMSRKEVKISNDDLGTRLINLGGGGVINSHSQTRHHTTVSYPILSYERSHA
jgi:hypothetical protein